MNVYRTEQYVRIRAGFKDIVVLKSFVKYLLDKKYEPEFTLNIDFINGLFDAVYKTEDSIHITGWLVDHGVHYRNV